MSSDAAILREILARECETVNHYESLAARAESDSVRTLVLHLASEEKEHIAECARLLAHVDDEYAQMMAKPLAHALGEHAVEAGAPPAAEPPAPAHVPGASTRAGFTIGSLISRDPTSTRG